MRNLRKVILMVMLALQLPVFCQQPGKKDHEVPSSFCISQMEYKLYTMINEYRSRYDLPPIPLSKSLCYVASVHVKDLFLNHPDKGSCNSHSWSANGHWKAFCYPKDETKKNSVWDKPKEITGYKGKAFEIVYWENSAVVIDSIVTFWKSVDYFNSFLMNAGKWSGKKWNAIGISIYENYAAAWFGELPDEETTPVVCGSQPPVNPVKQEVTKKQPQKKDHPLAETVVAETVKPENPGSGTAKAEPPKKEKKKSKGNVPPADTQVQPETSQPVSGRYYIIVKSQSPRPEMVKALEEIKRQGYSQAQMLEKDNKLRISVYEFSFKPTADSALREVKKIYTDAWILRYSK